MSIRGGTIQLILGYSARSRNLKGFLRRVPPKDSPMALLGYRMHSWRSLSLTAYDGHHGATEGS